MAEKTCNLLIASGNAGKIGEIADMLGDISVRLLSLADFPGIGEAEETGKTYLENAVLKARTYARQSGTLALADDSGLEVRCLDDRPGILSARYGGDEMPYADKIQTFLTEIDRAESDDRRARFVCSIAVAAADGEILFTSTGICSGRIIDRPRGSLGFGYDSVFAPDGCDETFGELAPIVKRSISHRSRALLQIIPLLRVFIANGLDAGSFPS